MLASYKLSGKYIFISGFLFTSVLGNTVALFSMNGPAIQLL